MGVLSLTRLDYHTNACTKELSSARIGRLIGTGSGVSWILCCCLARLPGLLPRYQLRDLPPAEFLLQLFEHIYIIQARGNWIHFPVGSAFLTHVVLFGCHIAFWIEEKVVSRASLRRY